MTSTVVGTAPPRPTARLPDLVPLVRRLIGRAAIPVAAGLAGLVFAQLALLLGPVPALALPVGGVMFAVTLRRPVAAVFLVVAALPIGDIAAGGSLQLVDIGALFAIALVVVARVNDGLTPLPWVAPMWWLLGLFALTLASTPTSISPEATFSQELQLATGGMLALAVAGACRTWSQVRSVLMAVLVLGIGASIVALQSASELRIRAGGAAADNRATGIFTQPNQLGLFASMVLLVAIGVAAGERRRGVRTLAIVTVTASLAALVLSLSRGAWIGALLACAAFAVLVPDVRKRLLLAMLPVALLGLAFGAAQPDSVQVRAFSDRAATLGSGGSGAYDNRPVIWKEARRQIGTRPLLGYGPGSFPEASARWRSEAKTGAFHAHNTLLTVAAEVGLPAMGLVLGFTGALALAVWRALRRVRSQEHRATMAGLGCALVALAGQGIVDFTLRNAVLFTFVWIVLGLLLATLTLSQSNQPASAADR